MEGQRVDGVVKSWKGAWGWIEVPAVGGDVFAHVEDVLGGAAVINKEAAVSLELGTDPKSGKPRALKVQVTSQAGGPRMAGKVEQWKDAWGWITSPDGSFENIFGHREDFLNGEFAHVSAGQDVTFEAGTDEKSGKPRAKRIELVGVSAGRGQKFYGEILSWKDQWGWITCPKVDGGDVFAHSDDLLTVVQVGMRVSFELGEDQKGRRRARSISAAGVGGKNGGGKGGYQMAVMSTPPSYGKGHFGGKGGCAFGNAMPFPMGGKGGLPGPQAFIGQRLDGQVTMWKENWGWISCPHFGGDIFSHAEDVQGGATPAIGSRCQFIPGTDNKGRMRALQIRLMGAGGKGSSQGVKRQRPQEDLGGYEGSVIEGEVKNWKSPWGWIGSPQFQSDIFAHKEDVVTGEELTPGMVVQFLVARDAKSGRWRAKQITPQG